MHSNIIGKTVSWKTVNGIRSGIIQTSITLKKTNVFLGYLVLLDNGKRVIVHPNSIISNL